MLSAQLIRIIETHAEDLTGGAVKMLQTNAHTPSYHRLSQSELHRRLFEVYQHLGRWLLENSEQTIQAWYVELGAQRCKEGIPFSEVLWALVLTKDHLRESIGAFMLAESALDLHREQEIYRLIGHFFDRAFCYAAEAYEQEASRRGQEALAAARHKPSRGMHGTAASLIANR
jgi:hypothetical protein